MFPPDNEFHPGREKPAFLISNSRAAFEARCHALYDGMSLEEIKYVLTPPQFVAVDLVFFKGMCQEAAATEAHVSQHAILVRLRSAEARMAKYKAWKAEGGK
jgi:predicted DNA-binding protein (UPF0251 family)